MKLDLLLLLPLLIMACEKSEVDSSLVLCPDKASGLDVVMAEIADYSCITDIHSGYYKEQTVYITVVADPACTTDGYLGVYDCLGEFIGNYKSDSRLKFGEFITNNR